MLPENTVSNPFIQGNLLYPDNLLPLKQYQDWEMGGIGLQQPAEGLQIQPWYFYWTPEDSKVRVQPSPPNGTPTELFTEAEVFELSGTFDQSMRWTVATMVWGGGVTLRWYDSAIASYVVTPFEGLSAFKLCHDDKRRMSIELGNSDILFTYIKNNNVYVRNQRDRFSIEYLLYAGVPNNLRITHFGMADTNRVEWRLRYRKPSEMFPWL